MGATCLVSRGEGGFFDFEDGGFAFEGAGAGAVGEEGGGDTAVDIGPTHVTDEGDAGSGVDRIEEGAGGGLAIGAAHHDDFVVAAT